MLMAKSGIGERERVERRKGGAFSASVFELLLKLRLSVRNLFSGVREISSGIFAAGGSIRHGHRVGWG